MSTTALQHSDQQLDLTSWLSVQLREVAQRLPEFDEDLGSREAVLERLLAAVMPPTVWADVVGPVYTGASLARKLEITRQAVHNRTKQGTLWALATEDGHMVYPASQFTPNMIVLPGLISVLRCFNRDDVDPWTLASWMSSSASALGGRSPLTVLQQEDAAMMPALQKFASQTAARWAQ